MASQLWESVAVDQGFVSDIRGWFAGHASAEMPWVLVHADDGVIWGRRESDGTLVLSGDVFGAKDEYPAIAVDLRAETLQQARVFGPAGELLVWRSANGFQARLVSDELLKPDNTFEEQHLLWGLGANRIVRSGFTWLREGQQGPQHAVPMELPGSQRPVLKVRHYIDYDGECQAFIALSRLVDLLPKAEQDK